MVALEHDHFAWFEFTSAWIDREAEYLKRSNAKQRRVARLAEDCWHRPRLSVDADKNIPQRTLDFATVCQKECLFCIGSDTELFESAFGDHAKNCARIRNQANCLPLRLVAGIGDFYCDFRNAHALDFSITVIVPQCGGKSGDWLHF